MIKTRDTKTFDKENIADIWPFLIRPGDAPLPADAFLLQRAANLLAALASPVLADFLLAPVAARLGQPLIDR